MNNIIIMALPIALVIFSNVFYNISTKYTPNSANPFLSLTATYVIAAVLSFAAFCVGGNVRNIAGEVSKLNWSALLLGISIIGLEVGYIYMYRAGWKISIGSLVANISLACVLLVIGVIAFKESISIRQIAGMLVCLVGLALITK